MHERRVNMDIMINHKEDEIIKAHFQSSFSRCQIGFKKSIKGRHFPVLLGWFRSIQISNKKLNVVDHI